MDKREKGEDKEQTAYFIALGLKIKSLREKQGMSLEALALEVGMNVDDLAKLEMRSYDPGLLEVKHLAEVFGLTPMALLLVTRY